MSAQARTQKGEIDGRPVITLSKMIPVSSALHFIEQETTQLDTENVSLGDAVGRVLAEGIIADNDLPPFDRSQMDGFAVRAADTAEAPVELEVVGESAAGRSWQGVIGAGQAVRIMTGARVPRGADAVQKLELTDTGDSLLQSPREQDRAGRAGEFVKIVEPAKLSKFIVTKGAEVAAGTKVFAPGEIITSNMLAAMAAFGYSAISVGRRPRVAILSTGSEIVRTDETPGPDQIRNSNAPMLAACTTACGGVPTELPIVADDAELLADSIDRAAEEFEILIITGGVSVGKYDLTKDVLRSLRAEIFFERVRLKPGKPTVFGKLKNALVFGLPGNPVSAAVTFQLFVRRALLKMQGAADISLPSGFAVTLAKAKGDAERDTFLPSALDTDEAGRATATPLKWLGSSDFIGFARADALIFVPAGTTYEAGEIVSTFKI